MAGHEQGAVWMLRWRLAALQKARGGLMSPLAIIKSGEYSLGAVIEGGSRENGQAWKAFELHGL